MIVARPEPGHTLQLTFDGHTVEVTSDRFFIIGRSGHPDLLVPAQIVSRRHMVVGFKNGWFVEDLGSRNGVYLGGRRIERESIFGPTEVRLGDPYIGPLLTLVPEAASVQFGHTKTLSSRIHEPTVGELGAALRALPAPPLLPEPEVALSFVPTASGAVLAQVHAPPLLPDGESLGAGAYWSPVNVGYGDAVGVGVEAAPVAGFARGPGVGTATETEHGVPVGTAGYAGHIDAAPARQRRTFAGDGLQIRDLGFRVKGGKQLLRDISLDAPRGTLTAIVGPSGAGKSTFAKALSGLTKPSEGQVIFDGLDVHAQYEQAKRLIGMVPQEDVIHGQLGLRRALGYAARLRLGADRTAADRRAQVDRALSQLDLEAHVGTRISKLSGGQRKRASVALELLTEPALLILDEPTSGLDPALDRQLMTEFRALADGGRSVLTITHSVACLDMCDQVLVLVPGGAPAFVGSEAEAFAHFDTDDWSNIFEMLKNDPQGCADRWRASEQANQVAQGRVAPALELAAVPIASDRPVGRGAQFATLVRRQFALMAADRGYSFFLLALPFVIGLLPLVVPGNSGLTQVMQAKNAQEPQMILTLLTIGAIFMGISMSIRDLVGERSIFERERAVGLSTSAYLAAKILVYNLLGIFGAIVIVWIATTVKDAPEGDGVLGLSARTELTIGVALTISIGILIGLVLSALVSSQNQVMPVLIVVLMVQMVLNGGLIPLLDSDALNLLSKTVPARWGLSLGAVSLDMHHLLTIGDEVERLAAESSMPELDPLWKATAKKWWGAFTVLTLMAFVLAAAAWARTRSRGR